MSSEGFLSVLTWLRRERSYVLSKWGPQNQNGRGTNGYAEHWLPDIEMYLHRTATLSADGWTPAAVQALAKAAAVIAALLELLADDDLLPPGGLPSGQLTKGTT